MLTFVLENVVKPLAAATEPFELLNGQVLRLLARNKEIELICRSRINLHLLGLAVERRDLMAVADDVSLLLGLGLVSRNFGERSVLRLVGIRHLNSNQDIITLMIDSNRRESRGALLKHS